LSPYGSHHGVTTNFVLVLSVPLALVTLTVPVVAPVGTVVVISVFDTTLKLAAVPLNVTLVAPVRLFPRILTGVPTLPEPGCVSTNAPSPILLPEALRISSAYDRSVYDFLSVALAVQSKTDLGAADERLAHALAAHLPVKWLGAL
jgi:hypothetical protein